MIKKTLFLTLFSSLLFSCTSDDGSSSNNSSVQALINFSPSNNGSTYSISDTVKNSAGFATRYDELKYYVSNITLFNINGDSTNIESIILVDYKTPGTEKLNISLESGTYSKIKFSIGLSEDLNQTDPNTVPHEHPLADNDGMYWGWGAQYRFITLQGFYSILPSNELKETFAWHPGKEPLYRVVELDLGQKHIYKGSEIIIDLNVNTILTKFEDVDIPNEPSWHGSPTTINVARKIVDNFVGSLSIKK